MNQRKKEKGETNEREMSAGSRRARKRVVENLEETQERKRLLEEEEVEIYLFTPTRVNETEASGVLPSSSKIQMNHEEAFAQ